MVKTPNLWAMVMAPLCQNPYHPCLDCDGLASPSKRVFRLWHISIHITYKMVSTTSRNIAGRQGWLGYTATSRYTKGIIPCFLGAERVVETIQDLCTAKGKELGRPTTELVKLAPQKVLLAGWLEAMLDLKRMFKVKPKKLPRRRDQKHTALTCPALLSLQMSTYISTNVSVLAKLGECLACTCRPSPPNPSQAGKGPTRVRLAASIAPKLLARSRPLATLAPLSRCLRTSASGSPGLPSGSLPFALRPARPRRTQPKRWPGAGAASPGAGGPPHGEALGLAAPARTSPRPLWGRVTPRRRRRSTGPSAGAPERPPPQSAGSDALRLWHRCPAT